LLCFYSGGNLTYSNPTYNKCYINTGSKQLSNQTKLVNVFAVNDGDVEIQLNGNHSGRITFFDLKGNQILAQNIQYSNTHVCLPSSGIYIFHFISERGNVQTGKILVN
jgi:hypothetical protein